MTNSPEDTKVDALIKWAKNHRSISWLIIIGILLLAFSNLVTSLADALKVFVPEKHDAKEFQTAAPSAGQGSPSAPPAAPPTAAKPITQRPNSDRTENKVATSPECRFVYFHGVDGDYSYVRLFIGRDESFGATGMLDNSAVEYPFILVFTNFDPGRYPILIHLMPKEKYGSVEGTVILDGSIYSIFTWYWDAPGRSLNKAATSNEILRFRTTKHLGAPSECRSYNPGVTWTRAR